MSSDLYISEIDEKYGDCSIRMNAYGTLFIYSDNFALLATDEHREEAVKIIKALELWIEHTKNIGKYDKLF